MIIDTAIDGHGMRSAQDQGTTSKNQDFHIEFSEADAPDSSRAVESSLRLLVRLLIKSAAAPRDGAQAGPRIPLDVAAPSKVGSDSN